MHYVISDIHGCYDEFIALLEKINFNENDELYVLGDMVDRGPEPIKVLQYCAQSGNIFPILGNHEYLMYAALAKLNRQITEENYDSITKDDIKLYLAYSKDGGQVTIDKFKELSIEQRDELLDYISEFSLYETVKVNDKTFILTHSPLAEYREGILESLDVEQLVYNRYTDYGYLADENTYFVSGHTPTILLEGFNDDHVYYNCNQFNIDCACVFGGRLACLCLDNLTVYYQDSFQPKLYTIEEE